MTDLHRSIGRRAWPIALLLFAILPVLAFPEIVFGRQTLWRTVMPTRGYLSQSELPVTLGLGRVEKVDSLEIRWPNGKVQSVSNLKPDALNVIKQER